MEHKAYIFEYDSFKIQLIPTLIDALKNNNKENLINFIQCNIKALKDPDNILTADEVWQNIKQDGNIDELGDLALTKFYDPSEDIGLGYEWWDIERMLKIKKTLNSNTMHLGNCIASKNNYFNPGKFGSYFQSPEQVNRNYKIIDKYIKDSSNSLSAIFNLKTIFCNAILDKKGLYITF